MTTSSRPGGELICAREAPQRRRGLMNRTGSFSPWETPIASTAWLTGRAVSARHPEKRATQARPSVSRFRLDARVTKNVATPSPITKTRTNIPIPFKRAKRIYRRSGRSTRLASGLTFLVLGAPIRAPDRLHRTIERDRRESPCCGQASIAPISTPWLGRSCSPGAVHRRLRRPSSEGLLPPCGQALPS